ncbi:sugar transferase [Pleionea sediminis]|uniref:sugar transferase n=1 Tax=Pleionea sediminis TaxID=2569479 RepID=UPI001186C633|nr:sugar transferase [Pleionea sediminis]
MYRAFGKRLFDLFIVISSVVLLSPLMLLISLLIKLFDPGPVIFKQVRVGVEAKKFQFYKFRSMPVNTGDKASDELGEISLTWIGKLIRRTNLDELPQLFNVLKGEMSFVGPRPPIPLQKELIELRASNGALSCKPGLTGLAQINSFDGMSVSEKAKLDGEYANKITFLGDIKIILNTFLYLLKPPPIY